MISRLITITRLTTTLGTSRDITQGNTLESRDNTFETLETKPTKDPKWVGWLNLESSFFNDDSRRLGNPG